MKTLTSCWGACVCVGCACEAKDHLHETASDDELRYVITERGRFKPIFTLQSMKRTGRESSDVLEKGGSHMVLAGTASFTDRLLLRLFQFYVNHWKEEVKANRSPTLLPYQEQGFEWHFQCSPLKYLEKTSSKPKVSHLPLLPWHWHIKYAAETMSDPNVCLQPVCSSQRSH